MLKMLKLGKKWRLHLTTVEEDEENARGKELLALTRTGKLMHLSESKGRYAKVLKVNAYEQLHFSNVAEEYALKELNRDLIETITKFQLDTKLDTFIVVHRVSKDLEHISYEMKYMHEIEIFTAQNMIYALRRIMNVKNR